MVGLAEQSAITGVRPALCGSLARIAGGDRSNQAIAGYHFAIPGGAELGDAPLRGKVDVMDSEALGVAIRPFEIVDQAPQEIPLERVAFGDRAMELREVVA